MPKLPVVMPQLIIAFLLHHGFAEKRSKGSHFRFYGTKGERVTVAFHNRPLAKGTLLSVLRQADLSKDDLVDFMKKQR